MVDRILYTIKKRARMKGIRISVRPAGVIVTMPKWTPKKLAELYVKQKSEWIIAAQEKLKEKQKGKISLEQDKKDFEKNKEATRAMVESRLNYFNTFYNFNINQVRIKNHFSRWGSCSSKGNLNFNYTLIKLPQELADYVVVHELCHLKEMNHSQRFWNLVGQTLPDYKNRKMLLRKNYKSE